MSVAMRTSWLWRADYASRIEPPLQEGAASASSPLDVKQRNAEIGEVIPIVFCRRVGEIGGVLISPPATEARFEDDTTTADVTASYHLVLSEGDIEPIQVRDVFQRACRVGTYTQTYDRRAGNFVRGNFIDNSPGLEAPYYCGSGGSYDGMSTMAFTVTVPAGFDQWNRQVHCFIRGGMQVTRLLDNTFGASNNVVDLTLYLLQKVSRINAEQIDSTLLVNAARFVDTNGLFYNGIESESANLRDWLSARLPYFLLRSTRINGKEALRPVLPFVASTGAINVSPVTWVYTFTEEHILPGSFSVSYVPLSERKPICALMLWRQQPTDDIGLIRTTEVRYPGTAADGPFEQHDLTRFCASEDHAVKVGTYILSKRKHVTHTLSIQVRPAAFNATLAEGDLVRVRVERVLSFGATGLHNYLYEVDRITKSATGAVQLELTHFPVDSSLRSVVALEVNAAIGSGIMLETGKTGVSCDVNDNDDTTIPPEIWEDVPPIDDEIEIPQENENLLPDNPINNPSDPIDNPIDNPPPTPPPLPPAPGSPSDPIVGPYIPVPPENVGSWEKVMVRYRTGSTFTSFACASQEATTSTDGRTVPRGTGGDIYSVISTYTDSERSTPVVNNTEVWRSYSQIVVYRNGVAIRGFVGSVCGKGITCPVSLEAVLATP